MSPEELQKLDDIKLLLLEIKSAFEEFTKAKKQYWKDEVARRRERAF
jgi:hypothetical protein